MELQEGACTDKEIIRDGAIKPCIWQNRKLDKKGKTWVTCISAFVFMGPE